MLLALALAGAALAPTSQAAGVPTPKPPSVSTGYAGQLTATSAVARTRVNPHGLATEYRFEYGPSSAYGLQTQPASAGAGSGEGLFAQTIAGLQSDTTYHYRAVATNSAGTSYGQDATFKTHRIPLTLTLTSTPNPSVFGAPLSVSGTLAGTGGAGSEVVLQGNPFPYTKGFHALTAPVQTSAGGEFSFPLSALLQSTELRAATVAKPTVFSAVLAEQVTVRVILHARRTHRPGRVRLYGTVTPAEPGAAVAFERLTRSGAYVPFSGTRTHGASGLSRFARTVRLGRPGLYRALVEIAPGAQSSGRSRPLKIR